MATRTFQHSSFGGGLVIVEFDINDANWRMSRVRCINNSDYQAVARIYNAGSLVFTAIAPPHQTTQWNISGIQMGWQAPVEGEIDGGLEMGNYTMQVQFPGSA